MLIYDCINISQYLAKNPILLDKSLIEGTNN